MQDKKQKYNKGSDSLPTYEFGKANNRHFARTIARRADFSVLSEKGYVLVMHHMGSCPMWVKHLAEGYDLACTLDEHGDAYFEYVGDAVGY